MQCNIGEIQNFYRDTIPYSLLVLQKQQQELFKIIWNENTSQIKKNLVPQNFDKNVNFDSLILKLLMHTIVYLKKINTNPNIIRPWAI